MYELYEIVKADGKAGNMKLIMEGARNEIGRFLGNIHRSGKRGSDTVSYALYRGSTCLMVTGQM